VDKPAILELVSRKAGSLLGYPVQVRVIDSSQKPQTNEHFERLLSFGKAHSDIIKIKE
jgi:hypothetical protein